MLEQHFSDSSTSSGWWARLARPACAAGGAQKIFRKLYRISGVGPGSTLWPIFWGGRRGWPDGSRPDPTLMAASLGEWWVAELGASRDLSRRAEVEASVGSAWSSSPGGASQPAHTGAPEAPVPTTCQRRRRPAWRSSVPVAAQWDMGRGEVAVAVSGGEGRLGGTV
jgi:hypothetical protein